MRRIRLRLPLLIVFTALLCLGGCTQGEGDDDGGGSPGSGGTTLSISTTVLPGGSLSIAYTEQVDAAGGTGSGYTWSLLSGALPAGLVLSSGTPSATISGTPTAAGTFNFTVQVIDDGANIASQALSITIPAGAAPLTITTTGLPGGSMGMAYSAGVTAGGGTGAGYSWSVASGALPSGLSLASGTPTATISGIPTATGTFSFTLQVDDSGANTTSLACQVIVGNTPLLITTTSLPLAVSGQPYTGTLYSAGGSGSGYTWSVITGTLPSGLVLTGNGTTATVSGTTTASASQVTFQVSDPASGQTATATMYVLVGSALSLLAGNLPGGGVGIPYHTGLVPSGGSGVNYQWSIIGGALPPGLSLTGGTPSCTISGTPTTAGSYNFTVQLQDGAAIVSQAYTIGISAALSITTTSLPAVNSGVAYSETVTAAGGDGNYTWAVQSGMPTGLTLASGSPSATISGSTEHAGSYTLRLSVTDGVGQVALAVFALTVNPGAFTISTTSLPDAMVGSAYSFAPSTSGGSAMSWALAFGILPSGVTFSAGGVFSGTPLYSGAFTVSIRANASATVSHTVSLTLVVRPAASSLTITTTSLAPGRLGASYTEYLTAHGGSNTGFSWAIVGGTPPAGVGITGDLLTGTPTQSGSFSLTLEVTDSAANTAQANLVLDIGGATVDITTASLPNGYDGAAYVAAIRAAGGTPPYLWSLAGGSIPAGTVLTSGTPEAALAGVASTGAYSFTLQVTDALGQTDTQAFNVDVTAGSPLQIDTAVIPSPALGVSYSFSISASGGSGAGYTWSSSGGDLPYGLTLSSGTPAATLSGTPAVPGAFRFALQVTDSNGATAVKVYLVMVTAAQALRIVTQENPQALFDAVPWSMQVYAEGGTGSGYNWSSSTIPAGYNLTPNGAVATLSGTPVGGVNPSFQLVVTDSGAGSANINLNLTVGTTASLPVASSQLTTSRLPGGKVGKAWRFVIPPLGGSGSGYTWSVPSGAMPPGLVLNMEGFNAVIEGVPLAPGSWSFTLMLIDGSGAAAATVLDAEVFTTNSLYSAALGANVAFVLDRSGSMYGTRHRTLRAEMENTVLHMEPGDSFDVVTFHSVIGVMWGQLRQATPANRAEALAYVHGPELAPAGSTATYPALEYALSTYPTSLETLALVSDGYPNVGGSASAILAAFPGWFAPYTNASVLSVGLGVGGSTQAFLQYLAALGNGQYVAR